jgi:hypothetical protein
MELCGQQFGGGEIDKNPLSKRVTTPTFFLATRLDEIHNILQVAQSLQREHHSSDFSSTNSEIVCLADTFPYTFAGLSAPNIPNFMHGNIEKHAFTWSLVFQVSNPRWRQLHRH